jgi:hypothetical protein
MTDDVDDLLRRALATLDDQAPASYFETLPDRTLARLDAVPAVVPLRRARRVFAVVGLGLAAAAGATLWVTTRPSDRPGSQGITQPVTVDEQRAAVGGPGGDAGPGSAAGSGVVAPGPAPPIEPPLDAGEAVRTPPERVAPPSKPVKPPANPVKSPANPVKSPANPVKPPANPVKSPAQPIKPPARPVKQVKPPRTSIDSPGKSIEGKPLGKPRAPDDAAPVGGQGQEPAPDATDRPQ